MIISEVVTFFLYAVSLVFLPEYFGTPVVHNLGSRLLMIALRRYIFRPVYSLRMEGRGYCCDQCLPPVYH